MKVVRVGLRDHGTPTDEELLSAAQAAADLMREGRELLVRCRAGLERTPTVVCATPVLQGWSLTDAYGRVIESRPTAMPTDGQLAALGALAARLTG